MLRPKFENAIEKRKRNEESEAFVTYSLDVLLFFVFQLQEKMSSNALSDTSKQSDQRPAKKSNNLGIGFERRHQERRVSSMQLEVVTP